MRHHDRPGHSEGPRDPGPPAPAGRAGGRHRRAGGGRRGPRRPSFRTAVVLAGSAAVVLTVATGMYVAAPATGTTAAAAPREAAAPDRTATGKAARFVRDVVGLVNTEREKAGCGPLRAEAHLRSAAQEHADDMAARGYYEHHSPEGRDGGDRMSGAGYAWSAWGENIHRGPKTPARAMEDWMDSPGHRANILNCSFKDIGVGVTLAGNGPWWVQDFGVRR
ncbi:CAP domain-containing protein [Streptomyces sp. NK15101]|uniref:CAP domain-containing protein n=1 Tax=Streptomyces sp. NK15101 TaxID=2873261 RepID=UPI001CEC5034|nr:CAP domain-containing protein [Streptomyces sp. NK15101]